MTSKRKTYNLTTEIIDNVKTVAKETGLTENQIAQEAIEKFIALRDNGPGPGPGGYSPDENQSFSYFAKLDEEKAESVEKALSDHGVTSQLTRAQLLTVAAKITGRPPAALLDEGLDYACQRAITSTVAGAGNQGSLGAADKRIVEAINQLREMVSSGIYKPRANKQGQVILGLSNVAGKAMTGVTTVRSFLQRKPEFEPLLDVTDL